MNPKVSIVVPCYNAEKHLSECLDSILKQSLHDLEVIAVNDGSTDRTLDILQRYAAQDVRLRIIDQSNQGAPQARANGVKAASADYIVFVDSDDYIYPRLRSNCLPTS